MQTVRIRRVTVAGVQNDLVLTVPLTSRIEGLQKLIYDELEVYPSEQKLYYGGKELIPDHLVTDYKIKNGDVIQLLVRHFTCNVEESESDDSTECANLTSTASNYYRTGDAIDVVYSELGAWFEAKVVKIFVDQSLERVREEDLIFQVVMDRNERTAPINVKFKEIRPRARYIYERAELRAGMVVLVNYNIQKPRERGYWYDLTITRVDGDVVEGNLILGNNHEGVNNCVIQFADEVMKIEPATPLTDRVEATGDIPLRKLPLYCDKCKDVTSKNCKECSCNICGKKNCIDKLIICDECEYTYHLFCLNPPLLEVPSDPEWYCPDCKTDESEIVRAGEKLKRIEGKNWIKKCKDQMRNYILKNHFGPVFGIEVGTCWTSRPQLCEIHGTSSTDIHYNEYHGVYSIILNGNNESDVDNGEEFYYTLLDGHSGSDRQTITLQVSSQLPTRMIKILALNCSNIKTKNNGFGKADAWKQGKPIRVIRSSRLGKQSNFAPTTGYRYDGIYKVVEYFPDIDRSGSVVWRYLLRRDDPTLAPWIKRNPLDSIVLGNCESSDELELNPAKKIKTCFQIDPRTGKYIDGDLANEKVWNECKESAFKGRQAFIEKVAELFTCACCQDIVRVPVTTSCKHNICQGCLKQCFDSEIYHCPSCRLDLGQNYFTTVNRYLEAALKLIIPGYGSIY